MALTTVQNSMIGGGVPITSNIQTVASDYTIPAGYNGLSAGPITIDTGYSVVVATGANWVIV